MICPPSSSPLPLLSLSPLSPAAASRLFELSWRCTEAAFLSSAPKTAAASASASAAQWDWDGQAQCARSAACGIIYYARNLIHVTYLLLNAPSERSKATQESETETERERESETETETETESESVSELELKLELESEQLVGACSRLVKLVNLLMTHARGRQQQGEGERVMERGGVGESSDCGGALMWVQFECKHKHKGRKHT